MVRRWLPLLAVAALLAAAFAAAALAEPQIDVRPLTPPSAAGTDGGVDSRTPSVPPEARAGDPREAVFTIPDWFQTVVGLLCALLVIGVVGALVFVAVRDSIQARGRPIEIDQDAPAPVSHAAEVAAVLDAGLDELSRAGSDPRSVVIGCWVRLEEAAGAAGTPRHPSDAPSDYVLRLLNGHQISRSVLDRLAAVYLAARYSFGDVDDSMRADAVSALQRLRAELDVHV